MEIKPYYKDEYTTLYLGDANIIMNSFKEKFEVIITDPVWPNAPNFLISHDETPYEIFTKVAHQFNRLTQRVIIQLGCNSDPRFLDAIPSSLKYFRTCWLGYGHPNYKEQIVVDANIAYVFGLPPTNKKDFIPGIIIQPDEKEKVDWHPCPRQEYHLDWIVKWFASNGPILDPFCGSGTTLVSSKKAGIKSVGIEIEKKWLDNTIERLKKTPVNVQS
jgi:hypothetical protein